MNILIIIRIDLKLLNCKFSNYETKFMKVNCVNNKTELNGMKTKTEIMKRFKEK